MVNELIEEKGLFLRIYERRDKFRFLIKKGVSGKNKVLRDLSSCIIRKFTVMRSPALSLERKKKKLLPFDIVYESTTNEEDICCYYSDNIYLAYRSYYSRKKRGKEVIEHPTARQCYYYDNFFSRKDSFETHAKTCSSITESHINLITEK